jgi:hypothetical protein
VFNNQCIFSFFAIQVASQPYYDAWFTHIYITNGNSEIDLIDGGTATVYDGQELETKLTFYNDACGFLGADLYTKIYEWGENEATSKETWVRKGSTDTDSFSTTRSGKTIIPYKVELWWENYGEHLLVDVKEYNVKIVNL